MKVMEIHIPERLPRFIAQNCEPFSSLKPTHQFCITAMLWAWAMPRYQHCYNPRYASFQSKWLQRLWGNLQTMRKTLGDTYFSVLSGSNYEHFTHGYIPRQALGSALIDYLLDESPDVLRDRHGRKRERPRGCFRSRAGADSTALAKHSVWKGLICSPVLPINIDALEKFCLQTNNLRHVIAALWLIRLARIWGNELPINYEQKSTGRIFEVFSYIQCCPREVLSAALTGCWDYDIANAHYSILSQWAQRLGYSVASIDHYLTEKGAVRQTLSEDCYVPIDHIKESLIGILYGGILHTDPRFSSIASLLGKEGATAFVNHPIVKGIKNDITKVKRAIVNDLPRHAGKIGNNIGVYAQLDPKSSNALCHALQGVEAQALRAVVNAYGEKIILTMHDGWVASSRLSVTELNKLISGATGFELQVEETQMPKYLAKGQPSGATNSSALRDMIVEQFPKPYGEPKGWVLSGAPQWSLPAWVKGSRMPSRKRRAN